MIAATANYKSANTGDSLPNREITITQTTDVGEETEQTLPVDLTGSTITVTFVKGSTSIIKTVGDGLTLTDAVNGVFTIDTFKLNEPGRWRYDAEIEFAGDIDKTYIKGSILIVDSK